MTKPAKKPKTSKEYEHLGRMLESLYETGYVDKHVMYRMSFIKGVVGGFGGVIGATVVVAMVAWALSVLHYVPFVNTITDNFRTTMERSSDNPQSDKSQP